MIQIDENGIRRMLESLKKDNDNTEAMISFGKDGLLLQITAETLEEKIINKIDHNVWNLAAVNPDYEKKTTEFTYLLPYTNLSVTTMLKEAIKSTVKETKRGVRGAGVPIPSCPVCQKAGKLKVMDGKWIVVYHEANGKEKAHNHAMTRYIKSLGMNPEQILAKLNKVIAGELKIENFPPSSGNLLIIENDGGQKLTSQDMGYYLKKLRESN
jgi:hypothetical protein